MIAAPEESSRTSRSLIPILIAVLVALLLGAGGAWWYFSRGASAPVWDRVSAIDLEAPAGDAFLDETPWVLFHFAPGVAGQDNMLQFSLRSRDGTPVPTAGTGPQISGVTAAPLGSSSSETLSLAAAPDGSGRQQATASFSQPGWWRVSVAVAGASADATFDVVLPDPNINGPGSVARPATSAEAEALYQQGMSSLTGVQSIHYVQWMANGQGDASISSHTVSAGDATTPPAFLFKAAGGMEAVVIGNTRWVQLPNDLGWTKQEGAMIIPPAEWGEEYRGATDFAILGEEIIDGTPTTIVAFLVPEVTEPQRQTAAWYVWWVDPASGHLLREAMVSRLHYMLNKFSDFNVPVHVTPPDLSGTPIATPAA